nr:hypothetical protein [Tanacetum cinerariifolium]GFB78389.1 hypothetical protein [Tanacetum cinerariifolium]
ENYSLADMINNGSWNWLQQIPILNNIPVISLNENANDHVKWTSSDGKLVEFNIKSAWWDLRDQMDNVKWWKVVWFPQCNLRSAFILWMAVMEKLYTQDRIQK